MFAVCGNTWNILKQSRFAPYFTFYGDFSTHYGVFPGCGTSVPFATEGAGGATSGACC
jgi:arsenite methyltransferase